MCGKYVMKKWKRSGTRDAVEVLHPEQGEFESRDETDHVSSYVLDAENPKCEKKKNSFFAIKWG